MPGSFTLGFNGRLGRTLMDAELAAAGIIPPVDAESSAKVRVTSLASAIRLLQLFQLMQS